jgi:hypothetical protein
MTGDVLLALDELEGTDSHLKDAPSHEVERL